MLHLRGIWFVSGVVVVIGAAGHVACAQDDAAISPGVEAIERCGPDLHDDFADSHGVGLVMRLSGLMRPGEAQHPQHNRGRSYGADGRAAAGGVRW